MNKYWLVFLLMYSCNNKSTPYNNNQLKREDFISFVRDQHLNVESFRKILVIPGVGCGGCISGAQMYYMQNYKDANTLYIFTGIDDIKTLASIIPPKGYNYHNLIIDTNNFIMSHGFKSIYPSFAEIDDNKKLITLTSF